MQQLFPCQLFGALRILTLSIFVVGILAAGDVHAQLAADALDPEFQTGSDPIAPQGADDATDGRINALQRRVGESIDVYRIDLENNTFEGSGGTYRLYNGRPYLIDNDGNPFVPPQPGAVPTNLASIGIDTDDDGILNANDDDIDGDGTLNEDDDDIDGDGISNVADNDDDGNGVADTEESNGNENLQSNPKAGSAVARAFLEGSLGLAQAMHDRVAASARELTAIMLVVWIFYQLVKLFMPFGMTEKASDIFNSIVTRIALTLLVVVGLQSIPVYERLLYGAADATIGLSGTILQAASTVNQQVVDDIISSTPAIERDPDQESLFASGNPADGSLQTTGSSDTADIRAGLIESITGQVDLVQATVAKPICIGMTLMLFDPEQCFANAENINNTQNRGLIGRTIQFFKTVRRAAADAWEKLKLAKVLIDELSTNDTNEVIASIMLNIISAVLIIVVYGFIWIKYPLTILDLVVRWAILLVVWPILVISLIFPAFRGTTVVMLKGVGHASLTLVFQAVIVGVLIGIVEQIMVSYNMDAYALVQGESIMSTYAFSSGPYLMVLITGFIMIHLINKASDFAGMFIKSTMDTKFADAIFGKVSAFFWIAVQALPGGAALNQVRKVIPIR